MENELLQNERARVGRLLDAIEQLEKNKDWKVLKEMLYEPSLASIERQLLSESLKSIVETQNIYRLQGEWTWAKQHADIPTFISTLKHQLESINQKLNE